MRELFSLIAGVLAIVSSLPYIINTAKGKTDPNLVTWLTWTIINAISAMLAWNVGAVPTEIMSGASAIATVTIVFLGLKGGAKHYTTFDIICQAVAIAGIVVWRVTNQPTLGAVITTVVSLLAAIPTWRHAWESPLQETWETFGIGAVANFLTLLSLTKLSLVAVASPTTFLMSDILLTGIILSRRQALTWTPHDAYVETAVGYEAVATD